MSFVNAPMARQPLGGRSRESNSNFFSHFFQELPYYYIIFFNFLNLQSYLHTLLHIRSFGLSKSQVASEFRKCRIFGRQAYSRLEWNSAPN